jgi:two-component system chemotaxis sensor kinase CheA
LQLGVASETEILAMSEKDKLRLIYRAGFSSKDQVTELSGLGVGLDAVNTALSLRGGGVDVQTIVGQGTTFHLYLPVDIVELKVQLAS